jgi:hypothetical protein
MLQNLFLPVDILLRIVLLLSPRFSFFVKNKSVDKESKMAGLPEGDLPLNDGDDL